MEQVTQEVRTTFPPRIPTAAVEPESDSSSYDGENEEEMPAPKTDDLGELEPAEPDLPSYEDKNVAELEEEIAHLSQGHIRNLNDIGFRVFWLNEKYKERGKKGAGEGVKAFCERICFDLNHWNYLVSKYRLIIYKSQPEKLDREQTVKAENALAKTVKKAKKKKATLFSSPPEEITSKPEPIIEKVQLSNQSPSLADNFASAQVHDCTLPSFDDVTEMIKRLLVASPPARQIEDLENLIDWIDRKINTLRLTLEQAA